MSPPRSISSSGSRSSNRMSNPNVFDDENELESLETPGNSPFDADDDTTPTSASPLVHNAAPNITSLNNPNPTASTPQQRCSASRKSSGVRDAVSSTPNRSTSRASNTFSDIHRASSTSSRFSMPRSQSPYVGATGPSHPYGMYPQITRASSTASASTVRPVERPFMAPSGPEHPYAMYSQNTVPEEDDVSLAQANIPLGFPGMAQQYQRENETRREDIADIVGSDGHVEELPPYTRYANEAAPKESPPSARAMPVPTATPAEIPLSLPSQPTQHADHVVELNTTASRNAESASSGSFKEKIKRKGKKRLCCGLPFCVIIGVLLLGVIIGAIIGGVVGSGKVASSSGTAESQNSSGATATVTATEFVDAAPLPTDHPIPEIPNGPYNISMNNNRANSAGCIKDPDLSSAWMCMPGVGIGITITGQDQSCGLTLDRYPLSASFIYGAQPPFINPEKLRLVPVIDRDSDELGTSLFAATYYDKLTILHESEFLPNGNYKRDRHRKRAEPGDRPWFCWFNQTMLEFFIYVDKSVQSSTSVVTPSTASSSITSSSSTSLPPALPLVTSIDKFSHPPFTGTEPYPPFMTASADNKKRESRRSNDLNNQDDDDDDDDVGLNYPLLVKIEEKRKPSDNIEPYCQQMRILEDGRIIPIVGVEQIEIPEEEASIEEDSIPPRLMVRGDASQPNEICACEWMNA